jgi:hypothetical protein
LCRHQGCTCTARADGYCSAYCAGDETGGDGEGHGCACGHDACEPPTTREAKDMLVDGAPQGRFVKREPRDW